MFSSTVTILLSLLVHLIALLSTSGEFRVSVNFSVFIPLTVIFGSANCIAWTLSGVTCTIVEAEMPEPSSTVAVMVASPTLRAVISLVFHQCWLLKSYRSSTSNTLDLHRLVKPKMLLFLFSFSKIYPMVTLSIQ